jgi:hypothetical protein
MSCKLFIRSAKDNTNSLRLLKFLSNNVDAIVANGMVIHVIKTTDKTPSPCMVFPDGTRIAGADRIMKHIIDMCEAPVEEKQRETPSESSDVKDMLMDILKNDDNSDDENDNESKDQLRRKIEAQLNKRAEVVNKPKAQGEWNKFKEDNANTKEQISVALPGDNVMDRYWDNLEETQI